MTVSQLYSMDWSEFDWSYQDLRHILRNAIGDGNLTKSLVYGNYIDYGVDIRHIVQRIETEANEYVATDRKIVETIGRNGFNEDLLNVRVEYWVLLRLDIKSFFIFTRIFMDTLARIVRLHYGRKGEQLPRSMRALIKNDALIGLDSEFARGLEEKLSWMENFIKYRVEFEHYLGGIPLTVTKNGKFGFSIRGSTIRGNSKAGSVESIVDYMKEILSHLSEDIQFICEKLKTSPI